MKKSLFNKLLRSYVLVTLLSIIIASLFFYIFFSQYYFGLKEKQILSQGKEMSNLLSSYIKNKNLIEVNEIVDNFNKVNISHMWVVDKSSTIISGSLQTTHEQGQCPSISKVKRALKGEVVYNKGVIKFVNEPVLSVALPIYVDGNVEGAIFVCNPLSDIINGIKEAFRIVIYAGFIAILFSISLSYFISMSIARPIKEITAISLKISKGNFSQKVKIYSTDEIGHLAETFNYMMTTLSSTMNNLESERNKMMNLEKLQRQFVANASHELRTPLTSVRRYVEAILDGVYCDKEQERKHLRIILKETLRLHRLVNSLLDLSRIDSKQIKINKTNLNVTEIIDRNVLKLSPFIEDSGIEILVDVMATLPEILGDDDLIDQIIINYITNAVRFTSSGGNITIKTEIHRGEVFIHVVDTGIGIPLKEIDKIWGRFYKIDETRQLSKDGAGLGLSLVKEIVELLGGRAWVDSDVGKGSTFSLLISNSDIRQKSSQIIPM